MAASPSNPTFLLIKQWPVQMSGLHLTCNTKIGQSRSASALKEVLVLEVNSKALKENVDQELTSGRSQLESAINPKP